MIDNGLNAEGFKNWEARAKKMTTASLNYSIEDCQSCIRQGVNVNKYLDQISVFRAELDKRIKKSKTKKGWLG